MREEQIHIPTKGSMVFTRLWHTKEDEKGIVLIIHDSAEHSKRYQNFALFLAHHGYNIVAFDLRGHGFSAMHKGDRENNADIKRNLEEFPEFGYMPAVNGWDIYLDDLSNVLKYMYARYPDKKIYLFGHGLGSLISASALSMVSKDLMNLLGGIIMSSPSEYKPLQVLKYKRRVKRKIRHFGEASVIQKIDQDILQEYNRHFSNIRTELDWISSQSEEVDKYISDPLCGNSLRLGLHSTIIQGLQMLYAKHDEYNANINNIPVLILSGKDSPVGGYGRGASQLEALLQKRGIEHVQKRLYPGRHGILHDWLRNDIYKDCLEWMDFHLIGATLEENLQSVSAV